VIEYILLFSLGFLTAVLVTVLVAPAIRRRIVHVTEHRIRATVPLSAAELRAQADMVRATYAAENAKLGVAVKRERDKGLAHELTADRLRSELKAAISEAASLSDQITHLRTELEARGAEIGERDSELERARAEIQVRDALLAEAERRAQELGVEAEHLGGFVDYGKIDLAVRETEIENLRSTVNQLKGERDQLRNELKAAEQRARDAEVKMEESHGRVSSLKQRLDDEVARNAEMDESLDRRMRELEKLKEKLAGIARPAVAEVVAPPLEPEQHDESEPASTEVPEPAHAAAEPEAVAMDQVKFAESIRNDARDVADQLANPADPSRDGELREEIASIAARMVALTATREGEDSPLMGVLEAANSDPGRGRISLAARAARALAGKDA
jgi:predicted  nucleic acid-binding Zn-ribbon protein